MSHFIIKFGEQFGILIDQLKICFQFLNGDSQLLVDL